jgi:hypothetical protein
MYVFSTFVKKQMAIACVGLFLDPSFYFIGLSVLILVPCCFYYVGFVV